jgi:hypothetical protein
MNPLNPPCREILLRDAGSGHRYWNERLAEGEVALFFSDVANGKSVGIEGNIVEPGDPAMCHAFPDIIQAKAFCQDLVKRKPGVRCEGYDRRGKAVAPVLVVMAERNERAARAAVVWKFAIAVVLIAASVPLFVWDYRHAGLLIIPTLFGINLVVVALRLFWWANGERKTLRARHPQ